MKPDAKKRKLRPDTSRSPETNIKRTPPSSPKSYNPRRKSTIIDEKYIVNINDYKLIENGTKKSGGFGIVNFAQNKITGKKYAAKTSHQPDNANNKKYTFREINILANINHPTIVHFHGASYKDFEDRDNITIFTDYMENGSLADILIKERKSLAPPEFDNTKKQIILIGIARGMIQLQKLHIINRDLKPANVLLDENFKPFLTDFGLSKMFNMFDSKSQSIVDCGTPAYMAPEVITSAYFNYKADVYSFGILMFEVVSGFRPYSELLKKGISDFNLKTKILNGERPKFPPDTKKSLKLMIEKCWSKDPNDRPTFSEIYNKLILSDDEFFADIDGKICEPVIKAEDINSDDEDDDENELHRKFCFDDVDVDELFEYVAEINSKEMNDKDKDSDESETKMLREEIKGLKEHNRKIEEKVAALEKDNSELKKNFEELKELVTQLKMDGIHVKDSPLISSQYELEMQCFELTKNVKSGQTTVYLPYNLQRIPDELFQGCKKLRRVIIPPSVTTVGNNVFCECSSLIKIEFPPSMKSIGDNVFFGCSSLIKIEFPPSMKSIGDNIFFGCSALKSIVNIGSASSIGNLNFKGCLSLEKLDIPKKVISKDNVDFTDCNSLRCDIQIPQNVTTIIEKCFYNCRNITSIKIPSSVTTIGNYAFNNCESITSIEIPNSTTIGYGAFMNCKSLTEIKIPSSVTSIGFSVFIGCESLKSIEVPSSVTTIIENKNHTNYYTNENYSFFKGCRSLVNLKIPQCMQTLNQCAFTYCSSLKEIIIESTPECISQRAFEGCTSLESFVIPSSVHKISANAFNYCSSLEYIKFTKSEYTLDANIFNNCTSLKSIDIPKGATRIINYFYNRSSFNRSNNINIKFNYY